MAKNNRDSRKDTNYDPKAKQNRNPRRGRGSGPRRDEERGASGPADRDPITEGAGKPGGNDISWYTRYPELTLAAAQFPYPYRPGMNLPLGSALASTTATTSTEISAPIPGIMTMGWVPSIGHSELATDPASILGKEIYSKVRSVYSGTLRADAPDYVIYIMALDSIYSYIAWLKRIYRAMNMWTPENYTLPDGLLHAMGLLDGDIQNLRAERMQLWQLINQLVLQSRKFTCPSSIDIINRHYWMNDNVYTDGPSLQSQMYMFNQVYALKYKLTAYDISNKQVGGVQAVPLPWYHKGTTETGSAYTQALHAIDLYNFGLDLINALIGWDDSYTVNGYLQRAYGDGPLFIVEEIPADAVLTPEFNVEVLAQIENSVVTPLAYNGPLDHTESGSLFSIWQNPETNAIISKPNFEVAVTDTKFARADNGGLQNLLNSHGEPTPLFNVIASRLKACTGVAASNTEGRYVITVDCASEIPLWWLMNGVRSTKVTDETSTVQIVASEAIQPYLLLANASNQNSVDLVTKYFRMCNFGMHPLLIVGSLSAPNNCVVYGELAHITTISDDDLKNLHRVCLFSEFNSFSMS